MTKNSQIRNTPRAVIYTRVSTEGQAEQGTSLAEQHAACMTKAQSIGAQVMATYEDGGVSGGLYLARPGIQKALEELEKGNADTLIIAKLDRCSRDKEHQNTIKKRVARAGARLVFCDMDFADTPEGDLQFGILGSFAEYERKVIRERTVKGARRAAMNGVQTKVSMRPFGYYIPSKTDVLTGRYNVDQYGKYQVVEEQARAVREIFRQIAEGTTTRAVCRWLTEQGIATPRKGECWRPSTITRILANPVYKGQAPYARYQRIHDESRLQDGFKQPFVTRERPAEEVIYIPCPALVTQEMWDACQAKLAENKEQHSGRHDRKYLLSGLLRCPECGRTMSAHLRMKKPSPAMIAAGAGRNPCRDYRYSCSRSRPSRDPGGFVCVPQTYNGDKAESLVTSAVCYAAQQPEATEAAILAHREAQRADFSQDECDRLTRELNAIEKREAATVKAQIRGITVGANTSIYEAALRDIALERTRTRNALTALEEQRQQTTKTDARTEADIVAEALRDVQEILEDAEDLMPNEKRNLLARVVDSILPFTEEDGGTGYKVILKSFRRGGLTVASIQFIGMPECAINLAQITTYLASAPKSNAAYVALHRAQADVREQPFPGIPRHLRDIHYKGAKTIGNGQGYQYPHDHPGSFVTQQYLPEGLPANGQRYYEPTENGVEAKIKARLERLWRKAEAAD